MLELVLTILVPVAAVAFTMRRLLTYLHAYQQEEYDSRLYFRWLWEKRTFDKRLSGLLLLVGLILLFAPHPDWLESAMVAALFLVFALREKDPRKEGAKKKLVLTQRARRIFSFALLINAMIIAGAAFPHTPLLWLIPVQLIPFTLALANFALKPFEDAVQQKFWTEAHNKVTELNPTVIGITGSFGKTSVKHILGHILQSAAPTLITPGSVNTPMGVTRIIREQLEKRHKYFVVEMGAYGPGSIKRLCDLTPPDLGVVTAIGHAHYERFKTLETVATAKFEMAEAAIAKDGRMVAHEDTLGYEKPGALHKTHPDRFTKVGPSMEADIRILDTRQSAGGMQVDIRWQGEQYTLEAPLYGLHHGSNMAIAFAIGITLGLPPAHIVTALKTCPQIAHRLEVKPRGSGGLLIDDAYNSNPGGFRAALDMLDLLADGRRRIVITPGMVEMGKAHDEEHEKIGNYAAAKTDIAIAVQPNRIPSFVSAYGAAKSDKQQLVTVSSFSEAQAWLALHGKDDDVILLENDLPDVYENAPRV